MATDSLKVGAVGDGTWPARLKNYHHGAWPKLTGYSSSLHLNVALPAVQLFQEKQNVRGDVAEIGVLQGRFFLALDSLRRPEDRSLAVDIFEAQHLNLDGSGMGNREKFDENIRQYSHDPSTIDVFSGDSLSFEIRRYLLERARPFRLFSVDGGHTVVHAMNDIKLAETHLATGGVVLVDDWLNPAFPGVTEAVYRFLQGAPTLAPVSVIAGKLIMVSLTYADLLKGEIIRKAKEYTRLRVRKTEVFGHEVLWVMEPTVGV